MEPIPLRCKVRRDRWHVTGTFRGDSNKLRWRHYFPKGEVDLSAVKERVGYERVQKEGKKKGKWTRKYETHIP